MAKNILIDSDWGSDVFQLAAVLLAHADQFNILGGTVTFGNAGHDQNLINAGALLRLLGVDDKITLHAGSKAPLGSIEPPQGDGAHGTDGLGGLELPLSDYAVDEEDAVDFILNTLKREPEKSITLIATGPQTNIARAIQREPKTMCRVREIRIMGGCVNPMPGWDVTFPELKRIAPMDRQGNITPHAEFNFQQDPQAANIVLNSGLPITLFPMDCTHQLTFTNDRKLILYEALKNNRALAEIVADLLKAPEGMDKAKFNIDAVMHDINTTISMVHPDYYNGEQGTVKVNTNRDSDEFGKTTFKPSKNGNIWVAQELKNPNAAFHLAVRSFQKVFAARLGLKPGHTFHL